MAITGGKPLNGEIVVRGAKNAVAKEMVAALLTKESCLLKNVSDVQDTEIVASMIRAMGGEVLRQENGTLEIKSANLHAVHYRELKHIAGKSRIPILFAGPLLARFHEAMLPELGGCGIGERPIDFHLDALQKMGATIEMIPKGVHLKAKKLIGAKIHLQFSSVGATEQVLLAGVLAEGVTTLTNAAIEPEILDLISVLQKMGAIISVDIDRTITITGVKELKAYEHSAIPDRNETVSWACAAAATDGKIKVKNARQADIMTFLSTFRLVGGEFEVEDDGITFLRGQSGLKPITIETGVHPGFMTDWQQPMTILLTQANGTSIIHETVYEERFGYVHALNEMGAKIELHTECLGGKICRYSQEGYEHSAIITGPTPLHAAKITVPDLRAGFSYVVAALVAQGTSTIGNIGLISRGYENFMEKLKSLGAEVGEWRGVFIPAETEIL